MKYEQFKKIIVSFALMCVFAVTMIMTSATPANAQWRRGYDRRDYYRWERRYDRDDWRRRTRIYRNPWARYRYWSRYPYGYRSPYRYYPYRYYGRYPYGVYGRYGRFRWWY